MKKITKIIGIALIFGLILVGFSGAVCATEQNIKVNFTNFLAPSPGYAPQSPNGITVTCTDPATDLTVGVESISWSPTIATGGTFGYNTAYTATIVLKKTGGGVADTTYKLADANSVSGLTGATVSVSGLTITAAYPATSKGEIRSVAITGINPITGGTPVTTTATVMGKTAENIEVPLTGSTVAWTWTSDTQTTETAMTSSTFEAGKTYIATITVPSQTNHTFTSSGLSATVGGNVATVDSTTTPGSLKISYAYPATTAAKVDTVTISGISEPNIGVSPSFSATATAKSGTTTVPGVQVNSVKWYQGNTELSSSAKFEAGKIYTVKVVLKLESSNAQFVTTGGTAKIGTADASITDTGRTATTLEVTKTFDAPVKSINSIDITVTEPSTGSTPSTTATAIGNSTLPISTNATAKWHKVTSGTVATTETTTPFEANSIYKVTVTIPKLTGTYADYTYNSNPTIKINGNEITASTDREISSTGVVTASYTFGETGKTKITTINISGIDSPDVGNSPDTTATAIGYATGSTNSISLPSPSVEWYLSSTKQTSAFEPDKSYTVKIKLTSPSNAEFSTSPTIKIGDITVPSSGITATATSIDLAYNYTKTNGTISEVTLTTTTPKLGEKMSTSVTGKSNPSNAIETPTLSWSPSGTKFEGGVEYTSTITVNTKSGYTFSGKPTVKLNGTTIPTKEITLVNDKKITIEHTYNKLATPITSVSITTPEPVVGKTASTKATITSVPSSDIDAKITWNPTIPETGLFDEETAYTATLTITNNNSDYVFTSDTTATINGNPVKVKYQSGSKISVDCTFEATNQNGLFSLKLGDEEATVPYPKDFFKEIIAFFKAMFDFSNWKIFK